MRNTVEILAVGNELLIGQTLDTNSNWLAKRLHAAGWMVQRITVVPDSLKSIRDGVAEAIGRKPALVLTLGGLGPTYDDMTLKGLSIAVGKELTLNRDALRMVAEKYKLMGSSTGWTVHRKKMALLPRGAKPLPNPVGTAPGVLLKTRDTIVVSLPGVPAELKSIFRSSVGPILKMSNSVSPREIYVMILGIIESVLAPILEPVRKSFPNLYLKSHPMGRKTGVRSLIKLHIYTIRKGDENTVNDAVALLLGKLASAQEG